MQPVRCRGFAERGLIGYPTVRASAFRCLASERREFMFPPTRSLLTEDAVDVR